MPGALAGCGPAAPQAAVAVERQALAPARDPAAQPFFSASPWNAPLGGAAVYGDPPDRPGCGSDLLATTLGGVSLDTDINGASWSMPVFAAASTDPLTTVRWYDPSFGIDTTFSLRLPAGATPASPSVAAGGDAHMHVIDPARLFVDEMWRVSPPAGGSGWVVQGHSRPSLQGDGWSDGGERAYGGSAIAGLMRTAEVEAAAFPHALALALDQVQLGSGPVWPASYQDGGGSYGGRVRMGQLVAVPPGASAPSGMGAVGQAIFTALQRYGAYVVDSAGGGPTLYAEPSADAALAGGGHALDGARADWRRIRPLLRCVANNGPASVGGGGAQDRAVPWAPPLAGGDATLPAVTITAPASGATVSGVVTLSASASDNAQVAGIQFFVDGQGRDIEKAPSASPSYPASFAASTTVDTSTLAAGGHTLSARARDAAGNLQSASISVTVGTSTGGGGKPCRGKKCP